MIMRDVLILGIFFKICISESWLYKIADHTFVIQEESSFVLVFHLHPGRSLRDDRIANTPTLILSRLCATQDNPGRGLRG